MTPVEVRTVEGVEALTALASHWDDLLSRSDSRSVFLTWDWVSTWFEFYRSTFQPYFLVAMRNDTPCGIVPTVVRKGASRRLEFVGQNRAFGEYLDMIVPTGSEPDVATALADHLATLCASGDFVGMNLGVIAQHSPNLDLIIAAFERRHLTVEKSGPRYSPIAELPGCWDDYLALKGTKLRKRIAYNKRRLERLGSVRAEFAETEAEIDEWFDRFVVLHNLRWNHKQDPVFIAFHRHLARRFGKKDRLLLAQLLVDGTTVAVKYDFVYDEKGWSYQGGWLPELAHLEIGSVLLCEVLEHCISRGLKSYDFLEGDEWYKRRWSTDVLLSYDLKYGAAGPTYVF